MATYASKVRPNGVDGTTIRLSGDGKLVSNVEMEPIGRAYYVDATNGSAQNSGLSWAQAVTTLDVAIDKCRSNRGDTIFVAPWHAETEAGVDTAIATMDTAGVSVIGVRQGNLIPTFTFTDDGATFSITGANCVIKGLKFISGVIDLAAAVTVSAAGDYLVFDDCEFQDGSATLEMVFGISIAAACNDVTIQNCRFFTTDAGSGTDSAIKLVGATSRFTLQDCFFRGDWDVSVIDGADAAGFDVLIQRNTINQLEATNGLTVSLNAATTGAVVYNNCHAGLNGTHMAAAGCLLAQNYETNAEGAQGFYGTAQDS